MVFVFYLVDEVNRNDGLLLLNKHVYLYFLVHDLVEQIILVITLFFVHYNKKKVYLKKKLTT